MRARRFFSSSGLLLCQDTIDVKMTSQAFMVITPSPGADMKDNPVIQSEENIQ